MNPVIRPMSDIGSEYLILIELIIVENLFFLGGSLGYIYIRLAVRI